MRVCLRGGKAKNKAAEMLKRRVAYALIAILLYVARRPGGHRAKQLAVMFGMPPLVVAVGLRVLLDRPFLFGYPKTRMAAQALAAVVDFVLLGFVVTYVERFHGVLGIPAHWLGGKRADSGRLRFFWPYLLWEHYGWAKFTERITEGPKKVMDRYNLIVADDARKVYLGTVRGGFAADAGNNARTKRSGPCGAKNKCPRA